MMSLLLKKEIQIVLDFTGGIFGIVILFFMPAAEAYRARELIHREGNPRNYVSWLPKLIGMVGLAFLVFNMYNIIAKLIK